MELEDTAIPGHFDRLIEIDTVGDANELEAERGASRETTEHVAKEHNSLHLIQLGRTHFFAAVAHRDRRALGWRSIDYGGSKHNTRSTSDPGCLSPS